MNIFIMRCVIVALLLDGVKLMINRGGGVRFGDDYVVEILYIITCILCTIIALLFIILVL